MHDANDADEQTIADRATYEQPEILSVGMKYVFVNGKLAFGHERHEAATPGRDSVQVKLKKGPNTVMLKINNGSNPHGFYLTILSGQELKVK